MDFDQSVTQKSACSSAENSILDITGRKLAEANQALLTDTLRILNRGGDLHPVIAETLRLIRQATGFDAVGLRLRLGEDCPYFEQNGFSEEFLREENSLCVNGLNGEIVRDAEGRAVLECTCGLILSGVTKAGMSCFTEGGSFWTNGSRELLALPREADPRINPRNRCIHAGFESVGLFPVRSGREIIGLLQLNGRRAGRFTPELIAFYEILAQNIGLALQRTIAEESLREREMRYRLHSEVACRLLASDNPLGIVNELCRKVMEQLDCHVFFNYLVDERTGMLRLNAYAGIPAEETHKLDLLDFGPAVCGCVVREGKRTIFNTPDVLSELVKSNGIQAYACHPLMILDKVIGTLSFGTKSRTRFSSGDLDLMKTVTDQVATAFDRMRLIAELGRSRNELELRVRERTAELERKNRELQEFAYVASHDLTEPLRKIRTFGDLLEAKGSNHLSEEEKDYISRMTGAADRMKEILDALFRYSRVETRTEEFRPVRLNDIAKDAAGDLEIAIRDAGVRVEIGSLPTIKGDPYQWLQVFQNLIANSAKYHRSEVQPFVKIYAEENEEECRIFVEDNGIGFDEKYLGKLFQPFKRLHGKNEYPGTGIGLAICRKIVERHGGTITAKSTPGKGATFILTLPMNQSQEKS
ncbi:MAG: GAF domain-containing protein [Desulfobacteraceae bacterium]|jgi:signal transduction histidine kinase|nr:MAG: GAF domain-containing protein [Desulfobacteraceae bacterium]